jgi:CRP-like cAMP-binding protein
VGLSTLERALLLQTSPLLGGATSAQLLRLAMVAVEERLTPETLIAREGEDPAIHIVVRGELRLDAPGPPDGPPIARPGDAIGLYETLADLPMETRAIVQEAGIALRLDGGALFDLLATDVELLQGLFAVLLGHDHGVSNVESSVSPPLFAV